MTPTPEYPLHETVFAAPVDGTGLEHFSWWSTYERSASHGLSTTAWQVLSEDCAYILNKGVFGAGAPGTADWPASRVRRGLVMGSVQSGKTASMLGVTAMALDRGVDAVVVLAGTQTSLWLQTYQRLARQLHTGESPADLERRRLLVPPAEVARLEGGGTSLADLYSVPGARARRMLRLKQPLMAVVMKHQDHLRFFGEVLRTRFYSRFKNADRPFHLLVLDDEADDGSILDADVEQTLDPLLGPLKQIPRAVADLWDTKPRSGTSTSQTLFVNYVGYTATPQANFLQHDHNPLAPTDFIASLRTPFDAGSLSPRETTFAEPEGLAKYYTGGETYYQRGSSAHLVVAASGEQAKDVSYAVRGFLVAGAIRLLRKPGAIGPATARQTVFDTYEQAKDDCASPHSMLIHPSARLEDQFATAEELLMWAGSVDRDAARTILASKEPFLPQALVRDLRANAAPWREWLVRFQASATALRNEFDLSQERFIPTWDEVERVLTNEVIPGTSIAVVNSDPRADGRPQFDPEASIDGWLAPRNLSTIFISGNVMSRGLTLEGLTTSLFLRQSQQSVADTQMQMQRWFGYRGAYLDLCRVIAPEEQLNLFRKYHDSDEALRRQVIAAMNSDGSRAPSPLVLEGASFGATSKIANVRKQPLGRGASPFIRMLNDGHLEDPNSELLAKRFRGASSDVTAHGLTRGRVLDAPLSLADAASLLDGLRFDGYAPGQNNWQAERWAAIQEGIGLEPGSDLYPLYRPPAAKVGETSSVVPRHCPYDLAAYFRLWAACLTRRARGLFPTDNPDLQWSMVDLVRKQEEQPRFWVGIRYGSASPVETGPLAELDFHISPMRRHIEDGQLRDGWGSRNPGGHPDSYLGDALFDYHHHLAEPPNGTWRPAGSDGQLLFHVIERTDRPFPVVTLGTCIPLGGPDQFAAAVA